MNTHQLWLVAVLSAIFICTATSAEDKRMPQPTSFAARLPVEGKLASLERSNAWLNSQPLSSADLRGKVVLIDFWTYTCINWRRTLPYLRAWSEKYQSQGLVVIGVHTPEFSFEHDVDNVRRAAKQQQVDYPIAVDNGYAIWNAFRNEYWPALYFVDAHGRIRHHQFGEGDYERLEVIIQQLLAEAGHSTFDRVLASAPALVQKSPPTGAACDLLKRMSATRARRTSLRPVADRSTDRGTMGPYAVATQRLGTGR